MLVVIDVSPLFGFFWQCILVRTNLIEQHNKWYVPVQDEVKRNFDRLGSTRKQIRFEDDLLKKIEENRGKTAQSFSEWVKDACKQKLAE